MTTARSIGGGSGGFSNWSTSLYRTNFAPIETWPLIAGLEPPVGFEPTTYRLQGGCSGQLS